MLLPLFNTEGLVEAGCDEAGRGCLAGPVFAAAVILPPDYHNEILNDSKQLTARRRYALREVVERDAVAWAVASVSAEEIDKVNILNASILAMHRALAMLKVSPEYIIVDGNRFRPYYLSENTDETADFGAYWVRTQHIPAPVGPPLPHTTIVKGDGKYLSIAAASILAKTYRDDFMTAQHKCYPHYGWDRNAGYPTKAHREGIRLHGLSPIHRRSFNLLGDDEPMLPFA